MHLSSKFTEHVDILCKCDSQSEHSVMLTNRKIPYFKQFIHVHLLHHWNSLSLSKSGTLTSMFEILHQTLRIHIAVCTTNVCEI